MFEVQVTMLSIGLIWWSRSALRVSRFLTILWDPLGFFPSGNGCAAPRKNLIYQLIQWSIYFLNCIGERKRMIKGREGERERERGGGRAKGEVRGRGRGGGGISFVSLVINDLDFELCRWWDRHVAPTVRRFLTDGWEIDARARFNQFPYVATLHAKVTETRRFHCWSVMIFGRLFFRRELR